MMRRFGLYYYGLIRKSIGSIGGLEQYDQNDNVKLMARSPSITKHVRTGVSGKENSCICTSKILKSLQGEEYFA